MDELAKLEDIVLGSIATTCECPRDIVSADTHLEDLGLDSFGIATVITDVETAFAIQLQPDQLMTFLQVRTVGDILAVIRDCVLVPAHVAP